MDDLSKRSSFKSAAKRAGIPWGREGAFVTHDMRHRRSTTWLAAGKSPKKVQEALGHSSLEQTMWYAHLVKENLKSLVEEPAAAAEPAKGAASG